MTVPQTITEAAARLRAGDLRPSDLLDEVIARADELDARAGVFITRATKQARAAAAASDLRFRDGTPLGPLDGIPIALKDIIADESGSTTAQSLVHDPDWSDAVGTATVAARLRAAGAIVVGKVSTMEFALGLPDASKPFPVPRNPWDLSRWAGGSSSGSASGIALEMFLGAVGTDTAGSIRVPAAFCGISGLKPTYGRVPKDGVVPLSYTLDHVGPMARSARDCATLLTVMAGRSDLDPYSRNWPALDCASALDGDLSGVRIAVDDLDRFALAGIDADQPRLLAKALRVFEDAGAVVMRREIPRFLEGVAVDAAVLLSEAHAYHAADLKSRWNDYGVATRVLLATADVLTGADYVQAQRVRRLICEEVAALFDEVDLVLTPTGHRGAPLLGDFDPGNSFSALPSVHASYWNPLGNPTLAVPLGLSSEGTPLSLSITARHGADALALRAGDALQVRSAEHLFTPPLLEDGLMVAAGSDGLPSRSPGSSLPDIPYGDWTSQAEESAMLAASRAIFRGLADLLWSVPEARYVNPLGGFDFDA